MGKAVMSMRDARVQDHWRRLIERTYPTRLESITFEQLPFLANDTLQFSPGITVLVGGNGVGKSTLITAIAEILSNGSLDSEIERMDMLVSSKTQATAFVQNRQCTMGLSVDALEGRGLVGERFEGEFRWLDPSTSSQTYVRRIRKDTNFQEVIEPVTPDLLTDKELDTISYLVGKKYTECAIYEIDDYDGLETFPYFKVKSSGVSYGSESMGRGELSLLLCYWVLRDLPKCSILILDEPETHVSPRSQDHLMNILAKFCDEGAISVIAATHSPSIIRRVPPGHIRLIVREAETATIVHAPSSAQIGMVLSGGVAYKGMLLVEDHGAKVLLLSLLEELAPEFQPQFEIVISGSEDAISKLIKFLPMTKDWLTVVGVYDGDMRNRAVQEPYVWPHVFLPGDRAPEILLRELLAGDQTVQTELATRLNKTAEDVRVAMNVVLGLDHHEWIVEFAKTVGRDVSFVEQTLVAIWISHFKAEAMEFIQGFRAAVNGIIRE
jgi:predicted ATPase